MQHALRCFRFVMMTSVAVCLGCLPRTEPALDLSEAPADIEAVEEVLRSTTDLEEARRQAHLTRVKGDGDVYTSASDIKQRQENRYPADYITPNVRDKALEIHYRLVDGRKEIIDWRWRPRQILDDAKYAPLE